jgi:hypothetical protein
MPGQSIVDRNIDLQAKFGANHVAAALTTMYFALFRGDPAGAGTEPTSTGGYARVAKTNDATLWGTFVSTDVLAVNKGSSGLIAFPAATGVYSITLPLDWWAVFDNSSGGVLRYWGQLNPTITVTGAGDVPRLPANSLIANQSA